MVSILLYSACRLALDPAAILVAYELSRSASLKHFLNREVMGHVV